MNKPLIETIGRMVLILFLSIIYKFTIYEYLSVIGFWVMQLLGFILILWALSPINFTFSEQGARRLSIEKKRCNNEK